MWPGHILTRRVTFDLHHPALRAPLLSRERGAGFTTLQDPFQHSGSGNPGNPNLDLRLRKLASDRGWNPEGPGHCGRQV